MWKWSHQTPLGSERWCFLGEQEAKMVVDKGSLIFRFPIERDYPEGTVVRPLAENEFIQSEGDRLCVYRRGPEDDIHYVCRVGS